MGSIMVQYSIYLKWVWGPLWYNGTGFQECGLASMQAGTNNGPILTQVPCKNLIVNIQCMPRLVDPIPILKNPMIL